MSSSFSEHYSLLTSQQLPPTDPKKSNKISDVVKLKRMLKKWRKQANSSIPSTTITASSAPTTPTHHSSKSATKHMGRTKNIETSTNHLMTRTPSSSKGIKFLKRTLSVPNRASTNATAAGSISSQSGSSSSSSSNVSKGYLAVDVGEEMKRFTIPMSYLGHEDFVILLKEAEEEFGFQQEGVLRIPCEVEIFEMILKGLEQTKNNKLMLTTTSRKRNGNQTVHGCGSIDQSQILTTTTPYHRHQYHPASPIYHPASPIYHSASPMCR